MPWLIKMQRKGATLW